MLPTRVYITSNVPLSMSGSVPTSRSGQYAEQVADFLYESGYEVVVISPAHEWVSSKPYPVRPIVFGSQRDNPRPLSNRPRFTMFDRNFPVHDSHPLSTLKYADLTPMDMERHIAVQMWTFYMSRLIFGDPSVVLNSGVWTWNFVTSGFPTTFVLHSAGLSPSMDVDELTEINRIGLKRTRGAIAPARSIAEVLSNQMERGKIEVIPGGFRKEYFDFSVESSRLDLLHRYEANLYDVGSDDVWVVYSREVAQLNGYDRLITAAAQYERVGDRRVMTIIMGLDGIHLSSAVSLAQRNQLDSVRFISSMYEPADVARFIKEADLIVFPSGTEAIGILNGTELSDFAGAEPVIQGNPFIPDDPSSPDAIRAAQDQISKNIDLSPTFREHALQLLDIQLKQALGIRLQVPTPNFPEEVVNYVRAFREYASRSQAINSIVDGVSRCLTGLNGCTRSNTARGRNLEFLTHNFGWDSVGNRVRSFLDRNARRRTMAGGRRQSTKPVSFSNDRLRRLNGILPDTDVRASFERLKASFGTDQAGRAFSSFYGTVAEWFGKRFAPPGRPLVIEAMPDPSREPYSVLPEVSRAASVPLSEMLEILDKYQSLPPEILTGCKYEKRVTAPPPTSNIALFKPRSRG